MNRGPALRPGTVPPTERVPTASTGQLDRATARSALRLLREPLWANLTLAVAVLSVTFVFLGRWQLHRHEAKVRRNEVIDSRYSAPPLGLAQVLPSVRSPLPAEQEWQPVEVTGTYQTQAQVLIRNRPLDGNFGYEVVVPLRLSSGAAVLVDRGWLPPGEDFVRPAQVPDPPAGPVQVVIRLRPGEPPLPQQPPPGQELRIDLARIAALAGGEVYRGGYGVLASERPGPASAPTPLPRPDEDLGPHLAYAVQWWVGAIAAWVLLGVYLLREARRRAATAGSPTEQVPTEHVRTQQVRPEQADDPSAPEPAPAAPTDSAQLSGPRQALRGWLAARRSRRGPTDEEWEDAADR